MTEHRLAVDSAEIHVEVVGEGIPVVLIHGLGLSSALWNRVREALGPGYKLVLVDLRGTGRSRELEGAELSLQRWAEDIEVLLRRLELDPAVLVGHSLGASIALKVALEQPDDVRGLVLIGAEANLSNLAPRMLAAAERIENIGIEDWVETFWSTNPPFSEASLERNPAILDEYRGLLLQNDAVGYVRQCRAIAASESLSARLGEVTQPTLVLIGGSDDRTLPEHGRELARDVPGARVVELPGVGHTLPLEAPTETAQAVRSFLEEIAATPAAASPGRARVLRADTTPRNSPAGPFGHLDVRWIVGSENGATLISFGQSTYPCGATHENHYHPNADEVVMVISGRGTQIVGDDALDLSAGDICFIPRNTPHRITGTSRQDLVILWALGGAASIEQAGYVPLPD
jgi:pimeloyl-ACP methyl ester carboxylesterase/quercetin dioxygenase-like cupin family protein